MKKELKDLLVSSKEVKNKYKVFGHFYRLSLDDAEEYKCRSVVEIVPTDTPGSKLTEELPDAVLIMMNPGSSSPAEDVKEQEYNSDTIEKLEPVLCRAKPDSTQERIMAFMEYMGWSHVRVINLSDLREGSSTVFKSMIGSIESDLHSIFSLSRRKELLSRLKRKSGAPIICAWGVSSKLDPLSEMAREALEGYQVVGWRSEKGRFRFYHANAQRADFKKRWVYEVMGQLGCSSE